MPSNLGYLQAFLGLNTTGLTAGLARARAALKSAGRSMRTVGRKMTTMISLPLAAIGGVAIKMAIDFQTSLRKINTLVGVSADRVNEMSKALIRLSNVSGESAVSLADALFVVTSAGQRGAEAMDIVERSAKSAALGLGETKDIARAVTAVMNSYGKENISAAKATDQLMAIVREGNLEASELAPVLGRVTGLASQLGIGFDEVGASIATFTRLGVDSAEAVTGLRGIMNSLIKKTEQGADALATMDMTFEDLRTMVAEKGLAQSLIWLMETFGDNKETLGELIPNVRALSAVLGTAGAQTEEYTRIQESIAEANGLVDDGFKSLAEDSGFKFKQTMQELKNTGIELGNSLLPIFNDFLGLVSKGVRWFAGLSKSTKALSLAIAGLMVVLPPVISLLGGVAVAISGITWPIAAAIGAIAALGAAIVYIAYNWDAIIERVSDWGWWKKMLIGMAKFLLKYNPVNYLIEGFNHIAREIPKLWKKIVDKVTDPTWWKNMLIDMQLFFLQYNPFDLISQWIQKLTGVNWEGMFDGLKDKLVEMKENFIENKPDEDLIANPFKIGIEQLEELEGETQEYEHQFMGLGETMKKAFNDAKKAATDLFGGGGGGLGSDATTPKEPREKKDLATKMTPVAAFATEQPKLSDSDVTAGLVAQIQKMREMVTVQQQMKDGTVAYVMQLDELNAKIDEQNAKLQEQIDAQMEKGKGFAQAAYNIISGAFDGLGNAMIASLEQGENALQSFGKFFADFAKNLIAKMISMILTALILAAVLSIVGFGVNAGGAVAKGVKFAQTMKSLLTSGLGIGGGDDSDTGGGSEPQGLASGGYVTRGGLFQVHKDELITLPRGAAVTPANVAQGMQNIHVTGQLVGDGDQLQSVINEVIRRNENVNG